MTRDEIIAAMSGARIASVDIPVTMFVRDDGRHFGSIRMVTDDGRTVEIYVTRHRGHECIAVREIGAQA